MHGILWTNEDAKTITEIWKYGYTWVGDKNNDGYVNEKTINYVVKYISKTDQKHKEYNSKILTSPGIGNNYINRIDAEKNKYKGKETKETYTTRQGIQLALPIYYRNKIYTEEEREKLWLKKLDEETRYICGEKIDISKNEEDYYKTLEIYRAKNKRLGYGSDEKNWKLKKYENDRRNLKTLERIKNANKKTRPAR